MHNYNRRAVGPKNDNLTMKPAAPAPGTQRVRRCDCQLLLQHQLRRGAPRLGRNATPPHPNDITPPLHAHLTVAIRSYVFSEGRLDTSRLEALVEAAGGPDLVVIDLSCRRKPSAASPPAPEETDYFVVTDRWQRFTGEQRDPGETAPHSFARD